MKRTNWLACAAGRGSSYPSNAARRPSRSLIRPTLWLGLLMLLAGSAPAATINRCEAADGVLVYTDSSCRSLGIAERGDEPLIRETRVANIVLGCAAHSPEALRNAVADAIAQRDFNALSGLYDFSGRSRRSAAPVVSQLERMARRLIAGIELVAVQTESLFGEMIPDTSVMPELRVSQYIQGDHGPVGVETFRLSSSAGCLWLVR